MKLDTEIFIAKIVMIIIISVVVGVFLGNIISLLISTNKIENKQRTEIYMILEVPITDDNRLDTSNIVSRIADKDETIISTRIAIDSAHKHNNAIIIKPIKKWKKN